MLQRRLTYTHMQIVKQCKTQCTHNICVKIQQTTVAVTRVDILNDITSKILGVGTLPWMFPLHKYWVTCPPCPIGIDAPGLLHACCLRVVVYAGIDAHEGMDVPKNAGIALAISFSILACIVFLVNIIKFKCIKHSSSA